MDKKVAATLAGVMALTADPGVATPRVAATLRQIGVRDALRSGFLSHKLPVKVQAKRKSKRQAQRAARKKGRR